MTTINQKSKLNEAKEYAHTESKKERNPREELITYFDTFSRNANLDHRLRLDTMKKIAVGDVHEAWKDIAKMWVERTGSIAKDHKSVYMEEISNATKENTFIISERMTQAHLQHFKFEKRLESNAWIKEAKPHFETLTTEKTTLTKQDWWFINRFMLECWYEQNGVSGILRTEEKPSIIMQPPPVGV